MNKPYDNFNLVKRDAEVGEWIKITDILEEGVEVGDYYLVFIDSDGDKVIKTRNGNHELYDVNPYLTVEPIVQQKKMNKTSQ